MENERYNVLGQIVEAVSIISGCDKVSKLIPEVRSNIVMCVKNPQSPADVAGIPGRLTVVHGKVFAPSYPSWAASVNTSGVLMKFNKYDCSIQAMMEVKYSANLIDILKSNKYILYEIPDSKSWESTIKTALESKSADYPILYSKGDWAREGAVIVCGTGAVEVAKRVKKIADLL